MKLQELILQDFRQFKGEQRINFATSFDRNVTLVFGANGSGKTTLLNAFTWVLYDLLSPDFEQKGRLINKETWDQAEEGSQLKVMVTLTFEHDGEKYEARRWADAIKSGEQAITSSTLELRKIGLDGASEEVPAPQDRISQLVPKTSRASFSSMASVWSIWSGAKRSRRSSWRSRHCLGWRLLNAVSNT